MSKLWPNSPEGWDRTREYSLDRRIKEMLSEACAALGIEPAGDESARWAAVLEATGAKRAAVGVVGYAVVDKDGNVGPSGWNFSHMEAVAEAMRDGANCSGESCLFDQTDRETEARLARQPFRVVPVGAVAELKPFGFGVVNAEGNASPFDAWSAMEFARVVAEKMTNRGLPSEAVELFYLASPPDRPAEAAEPRAGYASKPHNLSFSGSGGQVRCRACGATLLPEEYRSECSGVRL